MKKSVFIRYFVVGVGVIVALSLILASKRTMYSVDLASDDAESVPTESHQPDPTEEE